MMTDYGENSWHPAKRDVPVYVNIPVDKRFNEPCWPHGFSHWEPVRPGHMKGSIRYACKYIHKDVNDLAAQSKLAMSKRPPIGAAYFEQRAQKFVDEGISPQDRFYTFPNEARQIKTGKPIRFRLAGKSADLFCQHFIDKWRGYPAAGFEGPPSCPRGWHYPHSEFLEEYEDRITRDEWDREVAFSPILGKPKEKSIWQDVPAIPEGRPWRTPLGPTERPPMTPSQWVGLLAGQGVVFWTTQSTNSRGRWKLARIQPDQGKAVWMRSLMV
ncbi:hypothetical protein [Rhizobium sp.]|uniref:hypothetical protein n=1 Tax=Rhizobium sp. TaxID=391 RepID=UPI003981E902